MAIPLLDDGSIENCAFILESTARYEILHVLGEIDLATQLEFETALTGALHPGRPLVVDFCDCDYLAASALSVLVRARAVAQGHVSLCVPAAGMAARVLELAEFDRIFPIAKVVQY